MEDRWVIILTTLGTFIATIFGAEGYKYLTRREEIKSDKKCAEKIKALQEEMSVERLRTNQIVTGVDMMLTMLEEEYGDEAKYKAVIMKVREFIKPIKNMG